MTTNTMDLRITFSGSEEILNDIKKRLECVSADDTCLSDALAAIVQHTLIAAGVSKDFSVNVHSSQIRKSFGQAGGLNANEWLEKS